MMKVIIHTPFHGNIISYFRRKSIRKMLGKIPHCSLQQAILLRGPHHFDN